jgi:hypothetical protein
MTVTEHEGLARIIEDVLPDIHVNISDGQYGFASRQIASAILTALSSQGSTPEGDGEVVHLRPEVLAFAQLMERKLQENDHKPGWKGDSTLALLHRAEDELEELSEVVRGLERQVRWEEEGSAHARRYGNGWSRRNPATGKREVGIGYEPATGELRDELLAKLPGEAADVANFAMMITDVCGQLPPLSAMSQGLVGVGDG